MTTVLLHGFWGQPSDWQALIKSLPLTTRVWVPDLYEPGPLSPEYEISEWVDHFLKVLDSHFGSEPIQAVGYSLGGRLLLQAVSRKPERFQRTLLLSARPYLEPEEVESRERWELMWAEKFLTRGWEELQREWDHQEVFTGSEPLKRRCEEALREHLAQSLVRWSPRHHTTQLKDLQALPASVDWAIGALDKKYQLVAKTLQEGRVQGQIASIPGAGHRLLEQTDFLKAWILRGHA